MKKFISIRKGNIVGKGKSAGNPHIFLFQQCFQKPSSTGVVKSYFALCCKRKWLLAELEKLAQIPEVLSLIPFS